MSACGAIMGGDASGPELGLMHAFRGRTPLTRAGQPNDESDLSVLKIRLRAKSLAHQHVAGRGIAIDHGSWASAD